MNLFDIQKQGSGNIAYVPCDELEQEIPCEDIQIEEPPQFTLRPYQNDAVTRIEEELYGRPASGDEPAIEPHNSTLAVLATGLGKTVIFANVIKRRKPGKALVIAHRSELITQGKTTLESLCDEPATIEMANQWARQDCNIVVATVQTLISGMGGDGRMIGFNPMEFSLLVTDECFVAGTTIGGVPIQQIRCGDTVSSVNHDTGHLENRTVTSTFAKRPSSLMRLTFSDGRILICTPNHPIFSLLGYVDAGNLSTSHMMPTITHFRENTDETADMRNLRDGLHTEKLELVHDPVLQAGMHFGGNSTQEKEGDTQLPHLRNGDHSARQSWTPEVQEDPRHLQRGMQIETECAVDGEHEPEVRIGANDSQESDAQRGCQREGINETTRDGMGTHGARRKRQTCYTGTATPGVRSWMGNGSSHSHIEAEGKRLSDLLQGRHWESSPESGNRSGWGITQLHQDSPGGCEENRPVEFVWVDRIEVLKSGSDGTFGGLCPDGFVYNLEVEGNHNYFANGILVHNCHHGSSVSYKSIYAYFGQNPNLKHLGVTATPDRADEEALGQVYESVAFTYEIHDAIRDGYLVPIQAVPIHVAGLDYSSVRTTAGDLNSKDLAHVMEVEAPLHEMTQALIEVVYQAPAQSLSPFINQDEGLFEASMEDWQAQYPIRKTLIFAASVAHAERLCEIINRWLPGKATWVCGGTERDDRKQLFADYKKGNFMFLVNFGVCTEGWDEPTVEVVVMARPTKSRALYSQMLGRGTRPLPGVVDGPPTAEERRLAISMSKKAQLCVIDFIGNCGRHSLITPADILGGNYSDEVVERAKKNTEQTDRQPASMEEELERAMAQLEEEKAKEEARRAKIRIGSKYTVGQVLDPFKVFGVTPHRERGWEKGKPVSEKMQAWLSKAGVWKDELSFSEARQLANGLSKRREQGLCSFKQAELLAKKGLPCNVSFDVARNWIDRIANNRWCVPADVKAEAGRMA